MCPRFGTLCSIFIGGICRKLLIPPMKLKLDVPKRRHVKFGSRGIPQKK